MKQNKTYKNNDAALLQGLGVPKGKLIIAAVLITVMAFMWLRLLVFNKTPDTAAGGTSSGPVGVQAGSTTTTKPVPELTYSELPFVPGRHDVLANDIFCSGAWLFGEVDGAQRTVAGGPYIDESDIRNIIGLVTLDGIISEQGTRTPEAFVNGKLVSVGSKVAVEYNKRSVELTVTEIYRNKVVLRVGEQEIDVMMVQAD